MQIRNFKILRQHCELQIAWEEQYEGIICRARYVLIRKHERQGLGTGLERRRTFNWDIFLIIVKWRKGVMSFHDYHPGRVCVDMISASKKAVCNVERPP